MVSCRGFRTAGRVLGSLATASGELEVGALCEASGDPDAWALCPASGELVGACQDGASADLKSSSDTVPWLRLDAVAASSLAAGAAAAGLAVRPTDAPTAAATVAAATPAVSRAGVRLRP